LGLPDGFKKKEAESGIKVDKGVSVDKLKQSYQVIEEYPIHNPNAGVKIVKAPELGEGYHYFVDEIPLDRKEHEAFRKIKDNLSKELEPPENYDVTPEEYVYDQAKKLAKRYRRSLGKFAEEGWNKIFYYVVRNLAGYGPLHAMMLDPNIEDISCNGLNSPIYVWHRKYESIPTNITFTDEQTINDFIVKLAHRSAKHISSAQPLLDAMLPEKHRLAATFMKEVSTKGSTFCIRKFRADPFSVVDLIRIGTLNARMAAYFWILLERKMSFMNIGGTGSGKTSLLNALLSLMSQNDKIVTVEEVPELSPPLSNWAQFNSRQSFQFGSGIMASITLFDLVKMSLRYRPDYLIVGEVRGEEAYVLFQALATGHGGLCTMHADSLDHAVKRLTSPPINVSKVYIPLMNSAIHIQRTELPKKREGLSFGRRVRTVWEIEEFEQYREVATWNQSTDTFDTWFEDSFLLKQIAANSGTNMETILRELDTRESYLKEILNSGIRDQREVAEKILSYYAKKREQKDDLRSSTTPEKGREGKKAVKKKKAGNRRPNAAESETERPSPADAIHPETSEKIGGRVTRRET